MNPPRVLRLSRISRTVCNLAQTVAFYRDALNFRVIDEATHNDDEWRQLAGAADEGSTSVTMRLGEQDIELVAFDLPGEPYPPGSRAVDLWFQHIAIVVSDIDAAYTKLRGYSFEPISARGPEQLPPSTGAVIAYKFRDPDGHPLELIQFPQEADASMWQSARAVFLGIDHSAISVADIAQSVDFYTRILGLRLASRSINSGYAQQRLDNALDDLVEVVSLQPATAGPPHVELLGYKTPAGLPIPMQAKACDVFADKLVLKVDNLADFVDMLRVEKVALVSQGIVTLSSGLQVALARDPTGHFLLLCA